MISFLEDYTSIRGGCGPVGLLRQEESRKDRGIRGFSIHECYTGS